jgi:hypothetical protein
VINKRFGTPGRSTPQPNALADEARAALAAVEAEGSQRRSWRTDGALPAPSQSGKYPIDAIPTLKPVTRTLPPRRTRGGATAYEAESSAASGRPSTDLDDADIEALDPFDAGRAWLARGWLSGRNVAGAVLILVGLMSTWVTAIGWKDQPPTSERLRARRVAAEAQLESTHSGLYPNVPASERTIDAAPPASRERRGPSGSAGRPSDEPARSRSRPAERQSAPAAAPGLELRPSR